MYCYVTLTDGTHFRFRHDDGTACRVSHDQTDREQVWGLVSLPEAGPWWDYGQLARHIASYAGCSSPVSVRLYA